MWASNSLSQAQISEKCSGNTDDKFMQLPWKECNVKFKYFQENYKTYSLENNVMTAVALQNKGNK